VATGKAATPPQIVLGIDPGITGGLAWVSWDGKHRRVFDAPRAASATSTNRKYDQPAMAALLKRLIIRDDGSRRRAVAAMELVHTMPGDGAMGSFSFGFGFALWQGILTTLDVPIDFVDPRRWQKEMGMEPTSDRYQRKKNSRIAAMKFFPEMGELFRRVKDDGRAEALIMAEWLRRKMQMAMASRFDMDAPPPVIGEDASNYKGKGGWGGAVLKKKTPGDMSRGSGESYWPDTAGGQILAT
jgi:crossover junction endodeoxyribonuclease RuvC